jgi:hypothetical protein
MPAARARQPSERNNGEASRAFVAASEASTATASAQAAIPLTTIRWKVVDTNSTSSWGATRRSTSMSSGVPRRAAAATTNLRGLDEYRGSEKTGIGTLSRRPPGSMCY